MSSPTSPEHLDHENSIDFKNMNVFIKSVDESKPLGKLVKVYAAQKYIDGWRLGFQYGLLVGFGVGAVTSLLLRR
jgi:hypothetical protein